MFPFKQERIRHRKQCFFHTKCFLELGESGVVAAAEQPGAVRWERASWLSPSGKRISRSSLLVSTDHRRCVQADVSSHFGSAPVNLSIFMVKVKCCFNEIRNLILV